MFSMILGLFNISMVALGALTAVPSQATAPRATVTYNPTSENFANPERGFYHYQGNCDSSTFDESTLRSWRQSEGISLVMCIFYLKDFKTSPISAQALTHLQNQLDTARRAGVKFIIRFAYTETDNADASLQQIQDHLDQLEPYLRNNVDVIAVVQTGLIGTWGEWYYTQHFGDEGVISEENWRDRKAVADKLLSVVPDSRAIQLRTPKYKRTFYGNGTVPRVGHHNDCFLARYNDGGTYEDPEVDYPYLQQETTYVPMGGETCEVNPPRSDCPTATSELAGFHWSYLNIDYHKDVLAGLNSGGCLSEIKLKLGYRLTLISGSFPDSANRGGSLSINIQIRNDGYAAPFNARDVKLVLRNTASGELTRISLATDPKAWSAGSTVTLAQDVTVPSSLSAGTYQLLLELSDPLLANRPEYSIRLANEGTWDDSTGLNNLSATVTIA